MEIGLRRNSRLETSHESILNLSTNTYVEIDLEMKRKTLQSCEKLLSKKESNGPSWQRKNDILSWLSEL